MLTLGSLFDGSGGFPLAASLCGITPVWAAEIEPYPIAVTKSRFPNMIHLGDVSKINGAEIPPVDIVSFGSPCQDMSVSGRRAGLKHTDNGDDETTRSGMFFEAIRIIKEMREATNGEYPTFAILENVPGMFSSGKGEDFRIILEEFVKIAEPSATMPPIDKNGWAYADSYVGEGWSLSYRTFDAQYWGVAQRRRRCYAVLDLGGERSTEILFKRTGLRGNYTQSRQTWEGASYSAKNCSGAADCSGECLTFEPGIASREGGHIYEGVCGTLRANARDNKMTVAYGISPYHSNAMLSSNPYSGIYEAETSRTLDLNGGNPSCNQGGIAIVETQPIYALDRAFFNQGQNALYEPQCYDDGTTSTLVAKGPSAVCYAMQGFGDYKESDVGSGLKARDYKDATDLVVTPEDIQYIVRRLTPTECARLQGFPDFWGHPDQKSEFTDEEYRFWLDVRNTHAAINGKAVKDYTPDQMLKWYNKLHTDSAEYKMWGNGIALPNALYVMEGIAECE